MASIPKVEYFLKYACIKNTFIANYLICDYEYIGKYQNIRNVIILITC